MKIFLIFFAVGYFTHSNAQSFNESESPIEFSQQQRPFLEKRRRFFQNQMNSDQTENSSNFSSKDVDGQTQRQPDSAAVTGQVKQKNFKAHQRNAIFSCQGKTHGTPCSIPDNNGSRISGTCYGMSAGVPTICRPSNHPPPRQVEEGVKDEKILNDVEIKNTLESSPKQIAVPKE